MEIIETAIKELFSPSQLGPALPYLVFLIGLLVGSFLNVLILRLPRRQDVVFRPSHCPRCKTGLKIRDLFPVVSYLSTLGKCRYCKISFSGRYAAIEILTGVIFLINFLIAGISLKFLVFIFLSSVLIVVSFIDIDCQIIPDEITYSGVAIGLCYAGLIYLYPEPVSFQIDLADSILGMLCGFGLLYLIFLLSGGGMGGGDIKLAAFLGTFLGWSGILAVLILASILGAGIGLVLILTGIRARKQPIPFGPFIAVACYLILILDNYGFMEQLWYHYPYFPELIP